MGIGQKKIQVSVYLAKNFVLSFDELYKKDSKWNEENIQINDDISCLVLYKNTNFSVPKWASFFKQFINISKFGNNASTGALLIIQHNKRMFALSFGYARHLIRFENVERNFGLKVTLNCINESEIRCVDKSSLEAQPKELREQSGLSTDIEYFGIDVEKDLLKAVTGAPKEQYKLLGSRITGRDQVVFAGHVTLENICDYLSILLDAFHKEDYKDGGFAWVDHIGEVKDDSLYSKLDTELIKRLKSYTTENIWLSVPEIVDWENTCGFKYFSKRGITQYDVNLLDYLEQLSSEEITIELLKKRKIHSVDENDKVKKTWSSYSFIYADLHFDGNHYILNNSKWYQIESSYAKAIDQFYERIPRYGQTLPLYNSKTETKYNELVAKEDPDTFFLLDKKNIKISTSASPVEPCDIFRYPNEFIHVKRYGGSSVLSHLFNQGLVSGELFKREHEFKKRLKSKFGRNYSKTVLASANSKLKIVYAIISEYDEDLTIPFFSKISIKHAVTRLEALGYNVELAKIGVSKSNRTKKGVKQTK